MSTVPLLNVLEIVPVRFSEGSVVEIKSFSGKALQPLNRMNPSTNIIFLRNINVTEHLFLPPFYRKSGHDEGGFRRDFLFGMILVMNTPLSFVNHCLPDIPSPLLVVAGQ
jgi:hypothetical protein